MGYYSSNKSSFKANALSHTSASRAGLNVCKAQGSQSSLQASEEWVLIKSEGNLKRERAGGRNRKRMIAKASERPAIYVCVSTYVSIIMRRGFAVQMPR